MPWSARIGWVSTLLATLASSVACPGLAHAELTDFGNRLEGTLNRGFTENEVELVAFTGSPINYSLNTPANLEVWFFGSAAGVTIRAKELSPRLFYSMESKPGKWTDGVWNRFGPWPTKDKLIPVGVPANNLGVVVWIDESAGRVAPAFAGPPPSAAAPVRYTVVLRPRSPGTKLEFTLMYKKDGRLVKVLAGDLGKFDQDAPQRVDLLIDGGIRDGELLQLVIQPTFLKTQPAPNVYTLVHKQGRSN